MPSTHHGRPLAPAWSIIGLTSSVPIAFAITVIGLANISPFAANIIGLTYTLAVSLACAFVILAAHYPSRPNANPRFSDFLLRSARWLDVIDSNSGTRIGVNEMSDHTRERLRIAAGGVVRAPPSVRSTMTLPPYTPHGHPHTHIQRPERALDSLPPPPIDNMDFLEPRSRVFVADHDEIRPVDESLEAVIERGNDLEAQGAVVEAGRRSEH